MTTAHTPAQASDEPMLPCPFCGTQPYCMPISGGVYCNNDACAIVGEVFSGGPRHWNRRDTPRATADVERDAARYRWLRDKANSDMDRAPMVFNVEACEDIEWRDSLHGERLDAVMDRFVAAAKGASHE